MLSQSRQLAILNSRVSAAPWRPTTCSPPSPQIRQRAANLRTIVDDLRSQGITSVRAVAAELNERGILTPRGGAWHPTSASDYFRVCGCDGALAMSLMWSRVWPERPHPPHFKIFALKPAPA